MKKTLFKWDFAFKALVVLLLTNTLCANAQIPLPVVNEVNRNIYSPEATRPLHNLERNYKTNTEIMRLEKNEKKEEKQTPESGFVNAPVKQEKTKFKDLFKGFTVEW